MVQSFLSKTTDEAGVSMYQCIECGKISKVCTNLKDHIEATHIRVFHENTFSKEKVVHTLTCPSGGYISQIRKLF